MYSSILILISHNKEVYGIFQGFFFDKMNCQATK